MGTLRLSAAAVSLAVISLAVIAPVLCAAPPPAKREPPHPEQLHPEQLHPEQLHPEQPHPEQPRLLFTLIVERHGVRPPLATPEKLAEFATSPWPRWEVEPGLLTPHGAAALARMGTWLRRDLAAKQLFKAAGCPAAEDVFAYADTDERNIASTHAVFAAFAPGCQPMPVHIFNQAEQQPGDRPGDRPGSRTGEKPRDPFFNASLRTFPNAPAPDTAAAVAYLTAELGVPPGEAFSAQANPALLLLASTLAPDPARPAEKPLLSVPASLTPNPQSVSGVSLWGPLFAGSSLAEDLLLEYVDGKPLADVGWGRLPAPVGRSVERIAEVNSRSFALGTATPTAAAGIESNMMAHILATLTRAAGEPPDVATLTDSATLTDTGTPMDAAPLGPAGTHLVYLSGHDSNLHPLAGLLGLHWQAPGLAADDTPPDSAIVFELWSQPGRADPEVRLHFLAQTLDQLRDASPLTPAHGPVTVPLTPLGCHAHEACAYASFRAAVTPRLDAHFVQAHPAGLIVAP